ncbi:MAG: hypothetical protein IJ017_03650 [Oscillospiraceae bacterium]|nr:hypothetical protein [Oscillospiraceae bacterium]
MNQNNYTAAQAAELILKKMDESDKILIGAGAGLSAAAGLSYMDQEAFKKHYPEMAQRGFHFAYELVGRGDDEWTAGRKWAYWATHINYVRNIFPQAKLYSTLLEVLKDRDFFIVTSNTDRQFMRAGFPMERVFEFQGNYDNMGCSVRCTKKTWNNHEYLQHILKNIDHETFECLPEALPRCPYCGELADICFRGDDYKIHQQRYIDFVEASADKRICLIELGVGFNTPGVIRWPFENITYHIDNAYLFRINTSYKDYPYGRTAQTGYPSQIEGKITSLELDANEVINEMFKLI